MKDLYIVRIPKKIGSGIQTKRTVEVNNSKEPWLTPYLKVLKS